MHTNWHPVGCFFRLRENGQEFSLMSGERSFLNFFRDIRTPLDSIRDKLVTIIYFVIAQCPSVGMKRCSASCARNGYTWAARDLRPPEGEWLCIVCRLPDRGVQIRCDTGTDIWSTSGADCEIIGIFWRPEDAGLRQNKTNFNFWISASDLKCLFYNYARERPEICNVGLLDNDTQKSHQRTI